MRKLDPQRIARNLVRIRPMLWDAIRSRPGQPEAAALRDVNKEREKIGNGPLTHEEIEQQISYIAQLATAIETFGAIPEQKIYDCAPKTIGEYHARWIVGILVSSEVVERRGPLLVYRPPSEDEMEVNTFDEVKQKVIETGVARKMEKLAEKEGKKFNLDRMTLFVGLTAQALSAICYAGSLSIADVKAILADLPDDAKDAAIELCVKSGACMEKDGRLYSNGTPDEIPLQYPFNVDPDDDDDDEDEDD